MSLKNYRSLDVWQRAMDVVEEIYMLTKNFPSDEKFGLTSHMRRAAVSVPSNIAEGYGRNHRAEYLQFLAIARGSLSELETQLLIAKRLDYVSPEQLERVWPLLQNTGKMLGRLITALRAQTRYPEPDTRSEGAKA